MDSADHFEARTTHPVYPQLFELGGYLHQDWPDDYPDVWAAIDDYLAGTPAPGPRRLVDEVTTLLASTDTEDGLQKVVMWDPKGLLLQYYPPGDGYTMRQWLEALQRHVLAAIERP